MSQKNKTTNIVDIYAPRKDRANRRQKYGSMSTIGPRQVSILSDIHDMVTGGERATTDALRFFHGSAAINGASFVALRMRGLVSGRADNLKLTASGLEVARNVLNSVVSPGLGLVAVNVPTRKKIR
jgi:hypothetical protein